MALAPPARTRGQLLKDRLAFPFLAFMSSERARSFGLTPLDDERIVACLQHARGRLLDIGCGPNELVRRHGNGVGVDVHRWGRPDLLCDTMRLPFREASFDTVTLVASLNHIPDPQRHGVLSEAKRVLRDDGQLLVTMIDPLIGKATHWLRRGVDPDQQDRGIHHDEDLGLWGSDVRRLLSEAGFAVTWQRRFVFGLNCLYRATKS
jgi:SAM-dependent methyltransferase